MEMLGALSNLMQHSQRKSKIEGQKDISKKLKKRKNKDDSVRVLIRGFVVPLRRKWPRNL